MSFNIVKLTDPIQLTNVVGGLVPKGVYAGGTSYSVGDSVSYNGSSYVCILASTGNLPTDTTYWQVLANKGDTGAKGDTGDTGPAGADGADGADGLTVSVNSVTQVAGDISLTQDNIPDGTTNKAYTAAEQTKLSGIEALADVTDATNVASAGAVMDGDFSSNGLMTRTAAGTYANRTLTGTANQITVTNGDGVAGNPTLSLPQNIHTGATPTFAGLSLNNATPTTWSTPLSVLTPNLSTSGAGTKLQIGKANSTNNAGEIYFTWAADGSVNNSIVAQVTGGTAYLKIFANNFMTQGNFFASADNTYEMGASSRYWSNTYTKRLYLNSTAYLDGATAGALTVTGMLGLGSAPTHSITLSSTATGIALYNTADQTTNYGRLRFSWNTGSTRFNLIAEAGGSGSVRPLDVGQSTAYTTYDYSNNSGRAAQIQHYGGWTSGSSTSVELRGYFNGSSGTVKATKIVSEVNQSGTAGYTSLLIDTTETTTGSGTKLLIDAKVGGVSKFKVDNTGGIETTVAGGGIIMASPDGTRYKVTVANGGTLAVAAA